MRSNLMAQVLRLYFSASAQHWIILFVGGCPMHCSMFSSIPGPYPLEANSNNTHSLSPEL